MRFKTFLEAEQDFDLEKFKQDCAFYFQHTKGTKNFLNHGERNAPLNWTISTFKERTSPTNTPKYIHDAVNELFKISFGYPFRNGLFVSANVSAANSYGSYNADKTCAIFPIGEFEWLCNVDSEFEDFTILVDAIKNDVNREHPNLSLVDWYAQTKDTVIDKIKDSTGWNHNTALTECMNTDSEIMIKCDKFYKINRMSDLFLDVIKPMLENS